MVVSRGIGKNIEFIHLLAKGLEKGHIKEHLIITINPWQIQKDLKSHCNVDAEFETVYEGLKGLHPLSSKKNKGYNAKIAGYRFKIKSDEQKRNTGESTHKS